MTEEQCIYYVTGNTAKFREASGYIQRQLPEVTLSQCDLDVEEIQSLDHQAVAIDKACKAWQQMHKPVLIDDAGIYFARYNAFPGVLTKFVYKGIGREGLLRLVDKGDRAEFILYLVYCVGPTPEHCYVFDGHCAGTIYIDTQRTPSSDFPYDTLFSPDGCDGSYAQMREEGRDDEFSYRIDALKKFTAWFQKA